MWEPSIDSVHAEPVFPPAFGSRLDKRSVQLIKNVLVRDAEMNGLLIQIKLCQKDVIFIYAIPSHELSVSIRGTSIINGDHSTTLIAIFRLTSKLLSV